jgi:hypothetical protein
MWPRLWRDVEALELRSSTHAEIVTRVELDALPTAARSLLEFHRVEPESRKPFSLVMAFSGRFRLAPDRPWMPIRAVQFDAREPVTRIFHMKARMLGVLPILARDTYALGRGHLLARAAGIVTVAEGYGAELDRGELVTWVNDLVLYAPAMLLGAHSTWTAAGERAFTLAFVDGDTRISAYVEVDERGAPVLFETTDRFLEDPEDATHPLVRRRWTTPIAEWRPIGDRLFPSRASAVWHLPGGEFSYAEFNLEPSSLAFDVRPPSQRGRAA